MFYGVSVMHFARFIREIYVGESLKYTYASFVEYFMSLSMHTSLLSLEESYRGAILGDMIYWGRSCSPRFPLIKDV